MWTYSFDFPLSYVSYLLLQWCAQRSNTKRVPCWRLYLRESDQITLRLSRPSVSYHGSSWNITNRLVQCISLYEEKELTLNHIFPQTTMVYIIARILKGGYFTILHTVIESSSAKKNRHSVLNLEEDPNWKKGKSHRCIFLIWKSSTIDSRWNTAKKCTF